MSTERHVDPEVLQALDSVYEELRTQELALQGMPAENERLRARLERLQQGRAQLRQALRQGQSGQEPHLPPELEIPFYVRSSLSQRRRQRDVLCLLVLGAFPLCLGWAHRGPGLITLFVALAAVSGVRLLKAWSQNRSWFFLEQGFEDWAMWNHRGPAIFVPYSQLIEATARVTPAQHRRGVGTVLVKYRPASGQPETWMTLENAPEPERLVKWLRSRIGNTY
jgi:hypothetical protein